MVRIHLLQQVWLIYIKGFLVIFGCVWNGLTLIIGFYVDKGIKLDCCKSNSREIITLFFYCINKNKVGYLHRQPTFNVLSNNPYYEKQ